IALGQRAMAHGDLEAGRLIAPSSVSLRLGHPYCAFMPASKAERADVAGLVALLGAIPGKVHSGFPSGIAEKQT
ncbi:MAG: LysR family transcriptional regulator, partial [Mesorhizobium sp.]